MAPHILVVDDDADIRQLIADYLGEYNLRVSVARDAQSMQKALAQNVVDLIVLDLKLPDDDGMNIARELRTRRLRLLAAAGEREREQRVLPHGGGDSSPLHGPLPPSR